MKILLIILLVFYGLKLLTRYLGPLLLSYVSKKMFARFQDQFKQQSSYQNAENKQTQNQSSKIPEAKKKVGEYIDFEEID